MKQAAKNDGTKRQRFKRRKRRREREKASERERKRCDDIRTDSTRSLTDNGQLGRQSGRQAGETGEACQADSQSGVIVKQCSEDGTSVAGVK